MGDWSCFALTEGAKGTGMKPPEEVSPCCFPRCARKEGGRKGGVGIDDTTIDLPEGVWRGGSACGYGPNHVFCMSQKAWLATAGATVGTKNTI